MTMIPCCNLYRVITPQRTGCWCLGCSWTGLAGTPTTSVWTTPDQATGSPSYQKSILNLCRYTFLHCLHNSRSTLRYRYIWTCILNLTDKKKVNNSDIKIIKCWLFSSLDIFVRNSIEKQRTNKIQNRVFLKNSNSIQGSSLFNDHFYMLLWATC